MRRILACLLVALLATLPLTAAAQALRSQEHSFRVVKLVEGLEQPWSLAFLPDGRMLVTEKAGRLRVVSQGKLLPEPV
ncbi:MAG TPA: PQQ-dependent sugar dehydrogenase, partial [Burkholderiales bacterium]|nr:PQQ-dependent sugar dehydrogenase [Burkholderiales bacterium]